MSHDRLPKFQEASAGGSGEDIEMDRVTPSPRRAKLWKKMRPIDVVRDNVVGEGSSGFLVEVDRIRAMTKDMLQKVRQIENLYTHALGEVSEAVSHRDSQQIGNIIDETSQLATQINGQLQGRRFRLDVVLLGIRLWGNRSEPRHLNRCKEFRQARSVYENLTRNLVEAMDEYQKVQVEYRVKYKLQIQRKYLIVNPEATQVELARVLDDDNRQIFSQQLSDKKRQVCTNLQDRHREIRKIEQSIAELSRLFTDSTILIKMQDEVIKEEQRHVEEVVAQLGAAEGQINRAKKNTEKARKVCPSYFTCINLSSHSLLITFCFVSHHRLSYKWHPNFPKWRWICLLLTILIIFAVVLIILFTIKPWAKPGQ
ncbi:t-SNARE [Jimgerdemannia flammicorona]|uniref:t-SNARE n=1 Tax=Jimgerdemannia flammicorona TaxID=994334 RepID=A0A433PUD7_9FUNG|nr:t-SNARE [Jimgerdemannia flammicorona]